MDRKYRIADLQILYFFLENLMNDFCSLMLCVAA